jgi:4-oxalocrotonate tautomerase
MPLVRISLRHGQPDAYRLAGGKAVHQSLLDAAGVLPGDEFQVISEHDATGLIYDPNYLDIERDDDVVLIQITFNEGRTTAVKKALYAQIAARLAQDPGIRKENVVISLVEVPKENWSFGNGEAQYA